jgi:hypothetical protein
LATCPSFPHLLLRRQDDALAALGIARLIDDQHPTRVRAEIGMRLPALQSPAIERLRIPRRVMQKVVQRLPVGSGHDVGEFDERLVVLTR